VVLHAVVIVVLVILAAREGLLGKQIKKIAVEIVHEKPPEKPKEPEKPKNEPPKVETPAPVQTAKVEPPRAAPRGAPPPAAVAPPPVIAPPPAEIAAFDFGGGKSVQSSSDPIELYRGYVESALRAKWARPLDLEDDAFVAEVEVAVSDEGEISQAEWKKSSGNGRWDASVRAALAAAKNLDRRPPAHFPARVLVRFDVQDTTEPVITP
jgi:outer membrane biosynthesis protein TonB